MVPIRMVLEVAFPLVAAGTGEDRYAGPPGDAGTWELVKATFMPSATTAANGTNYTTLSIKKGSTVLGSITTATVAATAGTARDIAITGNGKNAEFIGRTDAIIINKAETGSGAALDGEIILEFERRL